MKPTQETYDALIHAYAFFNERLFENRLPGCIITMQRKKTALGYFCGESWHETKGAETTDEIALNPDHFETRTIEDTLSTLVHEMTHLEQHHFGKPSRSGYHNREWVGLMERVGLIPSNTGKPGGKQTGQKMTHYVDEGGRFATACAELLTGGFAIAWHAYRFDPNAAKKRASKTKYTCPCCGMNAWAKPESSIKCGDCDEQLEAEEV